MSVEPLLSIQGISASYGPIRAIQSVSIELFPGEIVSLIGANGAGKSTTLMTVSGIRPLKSGRVLFQGKDISSLSPDERVSIGIAQVPEGRLIFPRLTVLENLKLGAFSRRDPKEQAHRISEVYELFPILSERRSQVGGTLSGGEQQMLAIGRALMSHPKVLLLDEPSMGIAPIIVRRIFDTLKKLNQDGLSMLLVEQNAQAALRLAHRGYVLETGTITMSDNAATLLNDPRIQEAYLGE